MAFHPTLRECSAHRSKCAFNSIVSNAVSALGCGMEFFSCDTMAGDTPSGGFFFFFSFRLYKGVCTED